MLIVPGAVVGQQKADTLPPLEFRKWSGDINVPDPVALSVDYQGRVFVTQTRRRKIQDLDIRQHRHWVPNDLGLRTVADKSNFFKQMLAIGGDQKQQSLEVEDVNGDGVNDWKDLTVISEVVYRLADSDSDGTADEITVFAEDFKTEVTGIAAGIMAYDDVVYATVAPDLWRLEDNDNDGIADSQDSLAHGFGIHIAYAGHDMHGLTLGPDGKIYWSIGDKGINVTTSDGQVFAYPDQGGVMRCNPDGSDFEVFAHGLRNVQELAFDQYGNLFSVDNDADQPNEKERFVYIANEMDAGWRCYYQYRKGKYNPWTDEKLWDLPGEQHAAYIVPPISHFIDGPAGFKFNPGTALSPEYKDYFFLTGAPNGNQFAFRVEQNGDSFRMVGDTQIGSGIAIVGLAFGPDGALYGADWDGGYPLDEKGSVIRMDVTDDQKSEARVEVQQLLAQDFQDLSNDDLVRLLGHQDMRVRLESQFALVEKDRGDLLAATSRDGNALELAKLHSVWGLGQLARKGDTLARDSIALALRDKKPHVRAQAAKTFGELPSVNSTPLLPLLKDEDLHVRSLAALAISRHPRQEAVATLLEQAANLQSEHHYLRHALVTALAKCADAEDLILPDGKEMQRLVCTLALRRKASPLISKYLADASSWVANAAARGIHDDDSIEPALPELAATLLSSEKRSEPFVRRAISANFRLGTPEAANRVLAYASSNAPEELRLDALDAIVNWLTPDVLDRVEGIRRDLEPTQRAFDRPDVEDSIAALIKGAEGQVRSLAISISRRFDFALPLDTLAALVSDSSVDDASRVMALEVLSSNVQELIELAATSESEKVRVAAIELQNASGDGKSASRLAAIIHSDPSITAKQSAIRLLSKNPTAESQTIILQLAEQLLASDLGEEVGLEIVQALKTIAADNPAAESQLGKLRSRDKNALNEKYADFEFSKLGGNPLSGEQIFTTHIQAQCSRCHKVGESGSDIGPDLTKIATQRTPKQLLQSVVVPSLEIDKKYRSQLLLLESGQVIKGVIQSKDEAEIVIANSQGETVTVPADEVEQVVQQDTSLMPELTEVLTPAEVRDLVAYLRTLK